MVIDDGLRGWRGIPRDDVRWDDERDCAADEGGRRPFSSTLTTAVDVHGVVSCVGVGV